MFIESVKIRKKDVFEKNYSGFYVVKRGLGTKIGKY